ncbi:phage protein, partial [Trabulsiella guamensis ATCC 49490]
PKALAVRGEWQESRLARTAGRLNTTSTVSAAPPETQIVMAGTVINDRPSVAAASLPVRQAEHGPVRGRRSEATVADAGFSGEIHVHLHGVERQDAREIGRIVADAVNAELARRERLSRNSFRDRD